MSFITAIIPHFLPIQKPEAPRFFCVLSLLFIILPAYAEDEDESDIVFTGAAGVKSIIAHDELGGRSYLKPFASAGIESSKIDAAGEYFFWKGYTITDALFNEKEINIHQAGGKLTLYPFDVIDISGACWYFLGDLSYSGHKFAGSLDLNVAAWTLSAEYSGKIYSYEYNGEVKNATHTFSVTPEYAITDDLSIDFSYECVYTDYKSYGYTLTGHTLRAGISDAVKKNIFVIGGLSAGLDSNSIYSVGADCSASWKIFGHIKLSASYALTADIISSSADTAGLAQSMVFNAGPGGNTSDDSNTSVTASYTLSVIIGVSAYF